ncbi:hypothetical protein [Devosia sp. DBB001]|nr:hypothetical protein [Devosia sp. DBB001]
MDFITLPGGTAVWTPERQRVAQNHADSIAYPLMLAVLTICAAAAVLVWRGLA